MNRYHSIAILVLGSIGADTDAAAAGGQAAASLCLAREEPVFACSIGKKIAAVCGRDRAAIYRFGVPGHVELEATGLALADRGFSGGGETQIVFANHGYRYVVYDSTVRTSIAADGRHDADSRSGLLVQHEGKTVVNSVCRGTTSTGIKAAAAKFIPSGPFVEH